MTAKNVGGCWSTRDARDSKPKLSLYISDTNRIELSRPSLLPIESGMHMGDVDTMNEEGCCWLINHEDRVDYGQQATVVKSKCCIGVTCSKRLKGLWIHRCFSIRPHKCSMRWPRSHWLGVPAQHGSARWSDHQYFPNSITYFLRINCRIILCLDLRIWIQVKGDIHQPKSFLYRYWLWFTSFHYRFLPPFERLAIHHSTRETKVFTKWEATHAFRLRFVISILFIDSFITLSYLASFRYIRLCSSQSVYTQLSALHQATLTRHHSSCNVAFSLSLSQFSIHFQLAFPLHQLEHEPSFTSHDRHKPNRYQCFRVNMHKKTGKEKE